MNEWIQDWKGPKNLICRRVNNIHFFALWKINYNVLCFWVSFACNMLEDVLLCVLITCNYFRIEPDRYPLFDHSAATNNQQWCIFSFNFRVRSITCTEFCVQYVILRSCIRSCVRFACKHVKSRSCWRRF